MNEANNSSEISDSPTVNAALASLPTGAQIEGAADDAVAFAKENVGLIVAGGLAIGLVAAALMPRSKKKKLAKRSRKMSALVSELSMALMAQASDAASEGRDQIGSLSESVSERSQEMAKKAEKMANDVADQANDSGKAIARKVVKLIEKISG